MDKRLIAVGGVIVVVIAIGLFAMHSMAKANTSTTAKQTTVPAVNNAVLMTKDSSTLGEYLTDPSGKALYTFGGDHSGVSNCTGTCLAAWPAYVDSGSSTNLPNGVGTIKRTDNGHLQFTYNGQPLYYFASDSAGQATGNGVAGFHLAKPVASPSSSAAALAPASTPSPVAATQSSTGGSSSATQAASNQTAAPAATPAPAPASTPSSGW